MNKGNKANMAAKIFEMGQHSILITCNITMQLPSLKAYVVKPFQAYSCKV